MPGNYQIVIDSVYNATGIRLAEQDMRRLGVSVSGIKTGFAQLSGALGIGVGLGAVLGTAYGRSQSGVHTLKSGHRRQAG